MKKLLGSWLKCMICEKHVRKKFVKKNSGNWKKKFSQNKGFFLSFYQQKKILKNSYPFWLQSHFYKKNFSTRKMGQNFFCPKISPRRPKGLIIPMVGIMVQLPTNMEILVPQLNLPLLWFATLFSCSVS